jgi:hypothetical protein
VNQQVQELGSILTWILALVCFVSFSFGLKRSHKFVVFGRSLASAFGTTPDHSKIGISIFSKGVFIYNSSVDKYGSLSFPVDESGDFEFIPFGQKKFLFGSNSFRGIFNIWNYQRGRDAIEGVNPIFRRFFGLILRMLDSFGPFSTIPFYKNGHVK